MQVFCSQGKFTVRIKMVTLLSKKLKHNYIFCSHVEPLPKNLSDSVWVLLTFCKVALLFSLWTETVRPYLEIVDEWIVHGHLFDPAKEFIIQRYVTTLFF